jgi:endoglucanase
MIGDIGPGGTDVWHAFRGRLAILAVVALVTMPTLVWAADPAAEVTASPHDTADSSRAIAAQRTWSSVATVSPIVGPPAGGNIVTIRGKSLTGVASVWFGGSKARALKIISATKLTVRVPRHTVGSVTVRVSTRTGRILPASFDTYTYSRPRVTSAVNNWKVPNPLRRATLWVDPYNQAALAKQQFPGDAAQLSVIAQEPQAVWLGDWNPTDQVASTVRSAATAAAGANAVPTFALYAIPHRDCSGLGPGGFATMAQYLAWIRQIVAGLQGVRAVVILEPDALADLTCLSPAAQKTRLATMTSAVRLLTANRHTIVYLDAGNEGWHQPAAVALRLLAAGVQYARGFSVNVSNFYRTSSEVNYANTLSALLGGAHYVIDTSRNGLGAAPAAPMSWCNPPGRALGRNPTTHTGVAFADAFLWVKPPGASDGACQTGDPPGGQWFESYAVGLVARRPT